MLAEGERLGAAGADALRAYLVGYEVWAELLVARAGRLSPERLASDRGARHGRRGRRGGASAPAVPGEAAAMRSRWRRAWRAGWWPNFGTMTKPLHAGRAAACAIEAVRLAAAGPDRRARRDRASRRLSRRALAQGPRRARVAGVRPGQAVAHPRHRPVDQEVPDVLCDAPRDRRRARPGQAPTSCGPDTVDHAMRRVAGGVLLMKPKSETRSSARSTPAIRGRRGPR